MLDGSHYSALFLAYATAMAGAAAAIRLFPRSWPRRPAQKFAQPWREFGYALIAVVGVLLVGQLYQRGLGLPMGGRWSTLAECVNQVIIFSPMVVLLLVRRHPTATAWLPMLNVAVHIATGLVLASLAVVVFTVVREDGAPWYRVLARLTTPTGADKLVQVFLEDFSIAILLVRLGAALGRPILATAVVAFLFAAGHIPAMLSHGATSGELTRLLLDFALAAFVLLAVQRTASIWWFVWVHFAMDMMQFDHIIR